VPPHAFEGGVEGKFNTVKGTIDRSGCTHAVVLQPDVSDDPVVVHHAPSEEHARAYLVAMRVAGQAKGMRVVKFAEVKD
jgi:hypothetical protein